MEAYPFRRKGLFFVLRKEFDLHNIMHINLHVPNNKKKDMGDVPMKKMVILSAFICLICSLASPAFAESYNWGFNKGKNGTPADAGKNSMKCCLNMKRFIRGIQRKSRLFNL